MVTPKSVTHRYPELVRLVKSGHIDKARTLLKEITAGQPSLVQEIEHAILRDTGRTIT